MLVNTNKLLSDAMAGSYAVGAFNSYNLEITMGIIAAAEELHSPVILQIGAASLKEKDGRVLLPLMMASASAAEVPVSVHLDHSRDIELIQECLEKNISSVMYDGSSLLFHDNVKMTKEAVREGKKFGVPVEGEIGGVGDEEGGNVIDPGKLHLTDPDSAARFVEETKVDSLAIAIGNQHGFYREEPKLDFDRLIEINKRISVPIVLHGASGIPDGDIRKAIKFGVRKINVNTELRCAFFNTLEEQIVSAKLKDDLPRLLACEKTAVKEVVVSKLQLFGSERKAAKIE